MNLSKPVFMSQHGFILLRYLLALTLLFGYRIACCQVKNSTISADSLRKAGMQNSNKTPADQFDKLDAAINRKVALQQTQQKMLLLKQQAIESHDDVLLARALYELMKINDLRTEDTLYFRNSAFMDSILDDAHSSTTLKAIMYVLQAQRINTFSHRYLKFNRAAYRSKNILVDYASFNNEQLDGLWTRDMNAALACYPPIYDARKLLWLSSNPGVFLFDPRFGDVVLSEYINQSALTNYYNFINRNTANLWPSLPSAGFRNKLDSVARNDKDGSLLAGYQRWLMFNKGNNAISAFIESLARKYIFSFTSYDSISHSAYVSYLQKLTVSPYDLVRAHSVYQLCLIWNEDGNRYFNNPLGYSYVFGGDFINKNQYLPDSALQLFEKSKALMSGYPQFYKILTLMAAQIKTSGLSVSMNNKLIPNASIPIKVLYRNADTLHYRIIRVNTDEETDVPNIRIAQAAMSRKAADSGVFALPLPHDHNKHAVFLKLPGLAAGHYRLLFDNTGFRADKQPIYNIPFQVTSITAINSDERVYVLDRKVGTPLPGATIQAFKKGQSVSVKTPATVNKAGYFIMPGDISDSINIAYKGDTLGYKFKVSDNNRRANDNIYDKDDYDSVSDFYDDKLTMEIFTDRGIYRPGQTVHYKIILLTRDPQTGEFIVFNRQTLGGNDRFNAWLKKNRPVITLSDPFNHKVDSASMVLNEFGSFAGSFILPKTAATGEWDIDGKPETDRQNDGIFRVEEYKRPTIELSMEKQQKMLHPGEPFIIKLKVRSFSGGNLGNIL